LDVGGGKAHWSFPGARTVDPALNPEYHALHLPPCPDAPGWDYIFSSHALEHVPNYVQALEHWRDRLRPGGVVFLYLPHPACTYWWPWKQPTRRHLHRFTPELIQECLTGLGWTGVQVSGQDLAYSFAAYGVKAV
jgi:SAM-dependent methyltransferase